MRVGEKRAEVSKRFYVLFYSLLLFLLSKSIISYNNTNDGDVLIVSIVLVIFLIISSLFAFLYSYFFTVSQSTFQILYLAIYSFTGLVIIFTEPAHIQYLKSAEATQNQSFFPAAILVFLGPKHFLSKTCYFLSSVFFIVLLAIFSAASSATRGECILNCSLLLISSYINSLLVSSAIKKYKVMVTEHDQPDSEIIAPINEISAQVKYCVEKLDKISKLAPPKLCKTYLTLKSKLQAVSKFLLMPNIYSPRLETVTKKMDIESRLFIEQECFDSHQSSLFHSQHIKPKKLLQYSYNELRGLLCSIGKEWNFNMFFLSECTSEVIPVIGEYVIKLYRLDSLLSVDLPKLKILLKKIQENYLDNPYHNAVHAADVLCSFVFLVSNSNIKRFISSLEWLSGVLACLAHDLRHPAKNNRYLVMTQHEYALVYNDISVLEMMHAATFYKILKENDCDFLESFACDVYQSIRKLIIELILSTDMAKHFDIIGYTKNKYQDSIDLNNSDHRTDVFKLLIKCADLGHTAKSSEIHQKWCGLVIEEFYAQGDLEKLKGLPVSMFCDRENSNIFKSQAGFIKNVVLVLFDSLNAVLKSDEIDEKCLHQLKANQRFWEEGSMRIQSEKEVMSKGSEYVKMRRDISL